jgi:hypothetical protein
MELLTVTKLPASKSNTSKSSKKNPFPETDVDYGGDQFYRTAECAYYKAEARGFEPGYEMEDWLAAETEVQ